MRKRKAAFFADGADGRRYTVEVWINYVKVGGALVEIGTTLCTPTNQPVKRLGKGEYQLLTGLQLRSADANAP
jgi:hypothetical protein